jgi:hypothetical protein
VPRWAFASVVVVACYGAPATTDRLDAVEKCRAAFAEIASASAFIDAATIYARGCKDLYREPRCRDAVGRLGNAELEPSQGLLDLATECANAYCPALADPPRLCSAGAAHFGDELPLAWKELDARILGRELEVDPASPGIQRIAGAVFQTVTAHEVRKPAPTTVAPDVGLL